MHTTVKIQLYAVAILIIIIFSLIMANVANPDSFFYPLKRIQEKTFFSFKTTPNSQVNYLSNLLDIRLQEFKNLISNGAYSYLWSSSLRYSTTAGQMTDLVVASNLKDMVEPVKNKFLNHKKILDEMYVAYPKNTNNVEWKYLLDAINYLNAYLDKLSEVK